MRGDGFELVVTLGTGVGCALFEDGVLLPHLELSHGHYKRGISIDIALGDAERERIGNKRWNRRVARGFQWLERMVLFDRMYVGGGTQGTSRWISGRASSASRTPLASRRHSAVGSL